MNAMIKTIQHIFNENREINPTPLPKIEQAHGEAYKTKNNEIIYCEIQIEDFTIDELVRYTHIMETLYEQYKTPCTAYIITTQGVEIKVKEMPIKSEADFTIKLAQTDISSCEIVLDAIKTKMKNGELLNENDIEALQMIPMVCNPKDKDYYRKQVFQILSIIGV